MKLKILFFLLLATSALAQELSNEQLIVAKTILGEARGEGKAGMFAVACVIQKRALNRNLPPSKVCLQKGQFSCWNPKDPNRKKLNSLLLTPEAAYAKRLAIHLSRIDLNYVKGADHYCSVKLWRFHPPSWLKDKSPVAVVGGHVFFKLK